MCKAEAAYRNLREGQANKSARHPEGGPALGEGGHCSTIRQNLRAPREFRTTAFQAVLGHGQEKL